MHAVKLELPVEALKSIGIAIGVAASVFAYIFIAGVVARILREKRTEGNSDPAIAAGIFWPVFLVALTILRIGEMGWYWAGKVIMRDQTLQTVELTPERRRELARYWGEVRTGACTNEPADNPRPQF